jgi:type III secretion protein J
MRRLVLLLVLFLAGCGEQELYRGLTQRDANDLVAVLAGSGIAAERVSIEGGTYAVTVPAADFARAAEVASSAGLPPVTYKSLDEVFPGDKLVTSPAEHRARLTFALNQDLARSLSAFDGVTLARVHVVLPEQDLRGQTLSKAAASVLIRYREGANHVGLPVAVKAFVTNAVAGLDPADINVVLVPQPVHAGFHPVAPAPGPAPAPAPGPAPGPAPIPVSIASAPHVVAWNAATSWPFVLLVVSGLAALASVFAFVRRKRAA